MDASGVPARELVGLGRIETICVLLNFHSRPFATMDDRVGETDEGWRVAVLASLRSIKVLADQGRANSVLTEHVQWRTIVAALETLSATAVMAEAALEMGNQPSYTLLVRHRLPRAILELVRALQALTTVVLTQRGVGATGYAC